MTNEYQWQRVSGGRGVQRYTESRVRQCTLLPCCRRCMEVHKMTTLVTLMLKSYNQAHKAILAGTVTLLYK